tara:strand:- start:193 stop:495 length:303 start_codon:yes stop_codon:yes gene_type:complete
MHRVIQDLESGDLAKEQLILERQIQSKLQEKLTIKDTIIHQYQEKEKNLENELIVINEVIRLKDDQINNAKAETKHFKRQRNLFGLSSGGIIALIILILI